LIAVYSRLKYPRHLINSTVKSFITSTVEDPQPILAPNRTKRSEKSCLPFKNHDSADLNRKQLKGLSLKTHTVIQLVLISDKFQGEQNVHEIKPPVVNKEREIYEYECDLCDASYLGYTLRYFHQRLADHTKQSSSIGKLFICVTMHMLLWNMLILSEFSDSVSFLHLNLKMV